MAARRIIAAFALVVLAPGAAAAQFTTFVSPKKADTVAVVDSALAAAPTADSVARATIANMKAWVDSAAGPAVDLATTMKTTDTVASVTSFESGAPAPDTATPLPLIALLGLGAMGAGAALLRRK